MPAELVELALWMADEYCSTPARALSLVLPPPGRPRTELWAERTAAPLEGERLTDQQRALLAALPRVAAPDTGALRRLEARGLVAIAERQRRRAPLTHPPADRAVELTPGQRCGGGGGRAGRRVPPPRRHRLGQDGGLPARRGHGARARPGRDRARARDRAHAADRRPLPGAVRRHGRAAALRAGGGRALRRVAAAADGRGADRDRPAVGRVRAGPRPRADRRRRGARPVVQARGRPSLRRPACRGRRLASCRRLPARPRRQPPPARAPVAARRLGDAAAGDLGAAPAPHAPRARRQPPAAAGRGARHARRRPPAAPGHPPGAHRGAQGDPAAQPARLVELPHVPRRAARSGSARSATWRSSCTAPSTRSPAITAGTASACRSAATRAARPPSPATAPARSGSRPS